MKPKTDDTGRAFRQGLPLALLLAAAPAQAAETLPRPSADFAVKGRTHAEEATLNVAHSGGRLRLDITVAGVPGTMTGFVDTRKGRMVMLSALPGMQNMALELELPEQYNFADLPPEGTKLGSATIAGESCDIWRINAKTSGDPVDACVTADGIVLRTEASIRGKPQVLFEVTEVTRAKQDPKLFELPPGVRVTRVPKGMQGMVPGLGR